MSFYICSDDRLTSTFNGTYTLSKPVSGRFLISQTYFQDNSNINWVSFNENGLEIADPHNIGLPIVTVAFDVSITATDSGSIKEWFNTAFAQLNTPYNYSVNWTTSYSPSTDTYIITFDRELACNLYTEAETGDPGHFSSIATLFDWPPFGGGALFDNPFTEFIMSGKNFGTPNYFHVQCPQMKSGLITSAGTYPSFVLSSNGNVISNQKITIPTPTDTLDLSIYKKGDSLNTYDYNGNFDICFKQI